MLDKDQDISELISPGFILTDLLTARVKIYMGFAELAWKNDYIVIFRGIISAIDAAAGRITFSLHSSEKKATSQLLPKVQSALDGAIDASTTSVTIDDATDLQPGPVDVGGSTDTSFSSYIRVGDEIMAVTAKAANVLTVSRGSIGTTATSHSDNARAESIYRFEGNNIQLALKIMASNTADPTWNFKENVSVTSFERIDILTVVQNAIFFDDINVKDEFGVVVGDRVTPSGATDAANNVAGVINDIIILEGDDSTAIGSYIVVTPDSGGYEQETMTAAVVAFRSKYATLPIGLGLTGEEIDVAEFELLFSQFLSSLELDLPVKDTIDNTKTFLEQKFFLPVGAYSLPRKSKNSIGFHFPPIPGNDIVILNDTNVLNAKDLVIKRSISNNFYNTIEYQYDEDWLTTDFTRTKSVESPTSKARINANNKVLKIESPGNRELLSGSLILSQAGNRILDKYQFAAEYITSMKINLRAGFKLEVGDIVLLDGTNLQLVDSFTGKRGKAPRFYQLTNKTLDLIRGAVTIDISDTGFSVDARFGLISPPPPPPTI